MRPIRFVSSARRLRPLIFSAFLGGLLSGGAQAQMPSWPVYGGGPQHRAQAPVQAQPLTTIRWFTPVDLNPPYSGNDLFIHYGSPLITPSNTVLVTVKTGAQDGFQVEGHRGSDGALLWTQVTDYSVPAHGWIPPCSSTLTPDNRLVIPAAGGTVLIRANPDQASGTLTRIAFYDGNDPTQNYSANAATYNANVQICTPITSDSAGNVYFGFLVIGATPVPLQSGLARISASGVGTWVSAASAAGDASIQKILYNCAPALSNDGSVVYVAVNDISYSGFGAGYLLALDSTTMQLVSPTSKVRLKDAANPANDALLPDDGTASPMVGPDGDVYFGVLENPFLSNHDRGWMLHFSADLTQTKIPGAFGWDDTASVVPAAAVPSYHGASSYLILTKYNNYADPGIGGDGVNKVAILDPNAMADDPVTGACVMQEVITVTGVTPDPTLRDANHPNAVREWCINSAAVDAITKCALINSEDGKLYRWDFTTNTLSQTMPLAPPTGEAYTPTLVGPDGTVYAVNNATLFAVGLTRPYGDLATGANVSGRIGQTVSLRALLRRKPDAAVAAGKTFTFQVNGTTVGTAVTGADGLAALSYTIPESFGTGAKTLTAAFAGDGDYTAANATATLSILPGLDVVTVGQASGKIGQTVLLRGLLRRSDGTRLSGHTLTFKVSGSTVGTGTTDSTGLASINYTLPASLSLGQTTYSVVFAGDSLYSANSGTGPLTASKGDTALFIPARQGRIGETAQLAARLSNASVTVSGRTLTFSVNGTKVGTGTTDSTGVATLAYPVPESLGTGSKSVSVSFAGDATYNAAGATSTLTLVPGRAVITAASASGHSGQTVTLSATLKRLVDGTLLSGHTLTFSVAGTVVGTGVTGADGKASVSYTIPASLGTGNKAISVALTGDSLYAASAGTGTLTVSP